LAATHCHILAVALLLMDGDESRGDIHHLDMRSLVDLIAIEVILSLAQLSHSTSRYQAGH